MIDFKEFTEMILKEVQKMTGGIFDISTVTNMKNNGIKCTGISAMAKGSHCGPCIYLDGYYQEYKNKRTGLHNIADEIYRKVMEYQNGFLDINVMDFMNWDIIKSHVYAKLINADRNREQLSMIPYRLFLDLAVVYYIEVNNSENQETGMILINGHHMSVWGQNERTLYQTALINMRLCHSLVFENIQNILKSFVPEGPGLLEGRGSLFDMGAYVLTNCRKYYGASQILDKNTLKKISDKIKGDYILLPSSVHEIIILASGRKIEYGVLADMVREINATEVSAEEYLSDHVYVYNRSKKLIEIAA